MSVEQLLAAEAALAALGPKPFPLPLGPLAPVVAAAVPAMAKGDWIVAGPRERVGAVLRGCPVERLVDPAVGARPYKLAPVSGQPGARALHAVGLALGSDRPVLCFLGLASAAGGAAYEALNTAALTGAKVLFLHAAPRLTDDAPVSPQLSGELAAVAEALGLVVVRVDGVDALAAAVSQARAAVADGAQGPTFLSLSL